VLQADAVVEPVLLYLIVKCKVCTESQPAAFVNVFVYAPDVVYVEPVHVNVLQVDSVVEPMLLYLIVKFNVCTESQPAAFVNVFVYEPDVV
jgi:hypothetical protein